MGVKPGASRRPRILLVGAGHAHLHLVRHRSRLAEADVSLVDPGSFWYSGMAAGVLGARLSPAEDRLDPMPLARRYGVRAIRGRLASLSLNRRLACLDDGRELPFELLSLNVGSAATVFPACDDGPQVWTVKPIQQLIALRHRLEASFLRRESLSLVVVGSGASGIELACNLRALADRHRVDARITLVSRRHEPLAQAPFGARRWLRNHLLRRDIHFLGGAQAVAHHPAGLLVAAEMALGGAVPVADHLRPLAADHVVHAGGLKPPPVLERLGLAMIEGRGLAVGDTLQSIDDPGIFAAGDCAALVDRPLPRLGVYGVRQAPVLLDNLAGSLAGRPLRRYVPQARALAILDLGQGRALAIRGRLWWTGRASLWWKRWLDGRFMAQYRH
ncbi:NAD(P)/FAD-dependent oxidoreductase [Billgrantia saliphila]|uniref:NAD(P)/FAD-dependent oxidoreductase n=1 Tax=Billgrantia saliphila TaxID=1848458 RepID=UPI000CE42149|nr:FAD-dependent oxidoreductase [Halomonas saliphila]